jgi:AcrR family transcriptional regulator
MSSTEAPTTPTDARPMRADAIRNRQKILVAAREAFAQGGESTALEEIARRAGVGIGTLYRHFPTRHELVQELYREEVDELCRRAGDFDGDDAWDALNGWLEQFIPFVATKQVLAQELVSAPDHGRPLMVDCRASLEAAGEPLLSRAQEAGVVRSDVTIDQVVQIVAGIAKAPAADAEQLVALVHIALDGLRFNAPR